MRGAVEDECGRVRREDDPGHRGWSCSRGGSAEALAGREWRSEPSQVALRSSVNTELIPGNISQGSLKACQY